MTSKHLCKLALLCSTALISVCALSAPTTPDMSPPPYSAVTRHDVNVMTGQVQITHPSVKIGGGMGLTHSISTSNSSWLGSDTAWPGPLDGYAGLLTAVPRNRNPADEAYWMIASGDGSSVYFDPGLDPTVAIPSDSVYKSFPPIKGDKRYTLRYDSNENAMVMIKPDGTKVIYGGAQIYTNLDHAPRYFMSEIRKPNGFTIKVKYRDIGKPASVITNTGFQLRYYFLPAEPGTDPGGWSGSHADYVVGFNNAVEYCPHSAAEQWNVDCSTEGWPKVEYIWSYNTPMAFINGGGSLSVVNPDGTQTDYYQGTFSHQNSKATRITAVKFAHHTEILRQYTYLNHVEKGSTGMGFAHYSASELGVLVGSSEGNDVATYEPYKETQIGLFMSGGGHKGIESVSINPSTGALGGDPIYVRAWNFNADFYNNGLLETYYDKLSKVTSVYHYDARGNVTKIEAQGGEVTADYPACHKVDVANSNYKYCNKPTWTRDAKGNQTDFTYHQPSGQVQTVSSPADSRGIRPVTRNKYQQYYAKVLNSSGQKVQLSDGIWLLKETRTCANSETIGAWPNQSCNGNDEIVTSYEYEHDNLFQTGMTVYSERENKTLRTCYYYDKYGNQVGKTDPNANLQSCQQ